MISFDNTHPVILILTGLPGVGKSTLANAISPPLASSFLSEKDTHPIYWLEMNTLPPLQRLQAAQTRIEGEQAADRQKYEILHTLLDVFNNSPLYGAPSFENLIKMVRDLSKWGFDNESDYRQYARDVIGAHDHDALLKYLDRSIERRFGVYKRDLEKELEYLTEDDPDTYYTPKLFGVVVADLHSQDELLWLLEKPNSMILNLVCDEDIRQERLANQNLTDSAYPIILHQPAITLDTSTKVERMLLNDEDLPIIDEDLKRGKSKAKDRAFRRLLAEEFNDLLIEFYNIFTLETTNA